MGHGMIVHYIAKKKEGSTMSENLFSQGGNPNLLKRHRKKDGNFHIDGKKKLMLRIFFGLSQGGNLALKSSCGGGLA